MEAISTSWAPLKPRKSVRDWKRINKQTAVDHLGGRCAVCQEIFPTEVYDFHHLDPREKEMNISTRIGSSSQGIPGRVWAELKKTVVMCSNCHRIEHAKTGVWRA